MLERRLVERRRGFIGAEAIFVEAREACNSNAYSISRQLSRDEQLVDAAAGELASMSARGAMSMNSTKVSPTSSYGSASLGRYGRVFDQRAGTS
ncbi:MAG: hypothetical protein KC636_39755 [Myxococcales bacterium]|nr:hypothetical protein [Myxococcales bacterium]